MTAAKGAEIRSRSLAAMVAAAVTLSMAALVGPLWQTRWRAEASGAIVVRSSDAPPVDLAYQYDTMTRRLVTTTYAAIMTEVRFRHEAEDELALSAAARRSTGVTVVGSPTSALITASVTARQPWLAERLAQLTLERGDRYIASLNTLYDIDPVAVSPATRVRSARLVPLAVTLAVGTAVLLFGRTRGR